MEKKFPHDVNFFDTATHVVTFNEIKVTTNVEKYTPSVLLEKLVSYRHVDQICIGYPNTVSNTDELFFLKDIEKINSQQNLDGILDLIYNDFINNKLFYINRFIMKMSDAQAKQLVLDYDINNPTGNAKRALINHLNKFSYELDNHTSNTYRLFMMPVKLASDKILNNSSTNVNEKLNDIEELCYHSHNGTKLNVSRFGQKTLIKGYSLANEGDVEKLQCKIGVYKYDEYSKSTLNQRHKCLLKTIEKWIKK